MFKMVKEKYKCMRKRSPHAMTPTAIHRRGSSPPPPPQPHTTQKLASMVWSPTDNFIFTFLNLPPGAISQELARSILRQLWLDSIAKWSVIIKIRIIIRRASSLCFKIIYESSTVLGTSKYNVHICITSFQTNPRGRMPPPLPHLYTHMGMGACALGSLYAHEMQTWSRAR